MAGKVFENRLAVLLLTAMCFVHSSAQVGCMPAIASLSPCLGYITSSSLTPTDSCCTQVASVVKTQAQCLCSFLGSSTATQLGTIVSQAQALSLPGACKIDNPLANQCNAASGSQTPVAQSPHGAVAPASQETPSDQTRTNSSTTAAPSSLPIIPAGSGKAGQSSAAGASAKFMPFVFLLLSLASSASVLPAF